MSLPPEVLQLIINDIRGPLKFHDHSTLRRTLLIAPDMQDWKGIPLPPNSKHGHADFQRRFIPLRCASHSVIRDNALHLRVLKWYIDTGVSVTDKLKESFYALVQFPGVISLEIGGASPGSLEDVLRATNVQKLLIMQHQSSDDWISLNSAQRPPSRMGIARPHPSSKSWNSLRIQ
ncbi:hypothetical protein CPB83DRAFT_894516 [Crepidotus variabilis]|uniref:Uncharacterized protein n=1 Tax=Crepidotus variabilis TaxID=179855 RepID=A0A9P6EFZ5_9AGAR|nr:hypothetical protein CPB83DRAFT_894516 [Crepidotus variabilis]